MKKTISVHDWLLSFSIGESRKIPANCRFADLHDYASGRFGWRFQAVGNGNMRRVR